MDTLNVLKEFFDSLLIAIWQTGTAFLLFYVFVVMISIVFLFFRSKKKLAELTQMKNAEKCLHLATLEAVVKNYKGIIWSVDVDGTITTFTGQYLKTIGFDSSFLEGKNIELARQKGRHKDIIDNVEKTIREGPQDWIAEDDDVVFHSCTMPVLSHDGSVIGVVGSTDDVTEMVRLHHELENASQAKSNFLSNMSHEIRTPLNAIIGMVAIGQASDDHEKINYCLMRINDATKHLLDVVNDILDISKIEANKFELSPVIFEFKKIIQRVVNVISVRADQNRQHFSVSVNENVPDVLFGDDVRLAQVISNLLSNAVKFTPQEGKVTLEARMLSEENGKCRLQITVSDTGIGINEEQKTRLFRSFEQAEAGTTRKFGGTGLGLAITKRIVDMMDGEINVESEPGNGASFIVIISVERANGIPDELQDECSCRGAALKSSFENVAEIYNFAEEEPSQSELRNGWTESFNGKTVLMAEDVDINREIVMTLLEPTGLSVECAENGTQAVDMFEKSPDKYSMIFMDVQMPEMNGYDATRAIRALDVPGACSVPIIAMTANVFREDVEKCLDAGMNGHVGKPLDITELMDTVREYIA